MITLAVLISWNAVALDCRGMPEPSVTYRVEVFESRCTGRMVPCDSSGDLCPECHATTERATAATSLTVEEPAVNEVIGWAGYPVKPPPVVAVDGAGNVGPVPGETCP